MRIQDRVHLIRVTLPEAAEPSPDIIAYVYMADTYCPDCLRGKLARELTDTPSDRRLVLAHYATAETMLDGLAAHNDIDRGDEYSFDSDDFPKSVYDSPWVMPNRYSLDGCRCGICGGGWAV
jgi:hypothetical protein